MDELPGVLWAYRITSRKLIGVSPFALTYGMEEIIPTEVGMPTLRTEIHGKINVESITKDLDMVDKLREAVAIRIALYQQKMTNLYNRRVRPRTFRAEDLVLRRVFENMANPVVGKFQPN